MTKTIFFANTAITQKEDLPEICNYLEQCLYTKDTVNELMKKVANCDFPEVYKRNLILLDANLSKIVSNFSKSQLDCLYLQITADSSVIKPIIQEILDILQLHLKDYVVSKNCSSQKISDDLYAKLQTALTTVGQKYNPYQIKILPASDNENFLRVLYIPCGAIPRALYIKKERLNNWLASISPTEITQKKLFPLKSENVYLLFSSQKELPINRYLQSYYFDGEIERSEISGYISGNCILLEKDSIGNPVSLSDVPFVYWQATFQKFDKFFLGAYLLENENCFEILNQKYDKPPKTKKKKSPPEIHH